MNGSGALYAAKCWWPGVTRREVEEAGMRAAAEAGREPVTYLGALLFEEDDLVLCLFSAASQGPIRRAVTAAQIPCERLMAARWLSNPTPVPARGAS